ncbi:MAG TPA: pre-peptidase C-terminal domain-containing protein, partial [Rhizobacter sp.]|nr:pre-peptidase C-terminal domain-containing protein [Rhizobacter sp.]
SSSTDTDYYKVNINAGSTLGAKLTPNSGANYDLYIYNSAGTELASSKQGTGALDSLAVKNTGTAVATYYVRVRYVSGTTGAAGTYSLAID